MYQIMGALTTVKCSIRIPAT